MNISVTASYRFRVSKTGNKLFLFVSTRVSAATSLRLPVAVATGLRVQRGGGGPGLSSDHCYGPAWP